MILLDTDVAIDLFRGHKPALSWLASFGFEQIVIPGFVAMELIQGCRNKAALDATEFEIAKYAVLWLDGNACDQAMRIFKQFRLSHGIGLIDSLIAQTAVEYGVPLYTHNLKHYSMILGLTAIIPYNR